MNKQMQFGVKIILRNGHALLITMPEATGQQRAGDMVRKWHSNWFQANKIAKIEGVNDPLPWSVLVEEVISMQAYAMEAQPQQGFPEFKPLTSLAG